MDSHHTLAGLSFLLLTLVVLGRKYLRASKRECLNAWGWTGLGVILLAEALLFAHFKWISVFFTPVCWTGYILLVDSLVWTLRGSSRLSESPRAFFWLALGSVPLWLVFEAYNLRLENWTYIGLPLSTGLQAAGYAWAFATIWPGIFETADLVQSLGLDGWLKRRAIAFSAAGRLRFLLSGLACVAVPVLLPQRIGSYLFGAVWVGFVFLLDPINYRLNGESFLRDLEQGQTSRFTSFLVSGLVCGIFWEFWNYWAAAKWVYIFPIGQHLKLFEMPAPGFLGFPPFALECFVMYEFLRTVRKSFLGLPEEARWEAAGSQP